MPDLNINPDIVCSIISSIRKFQSQEYVSLEDTFIDPSIEDDDDLEELLTNYDDDLTYQQAKLLIDDLEPDQQITLVALMYLGRGDFTIDDWDDAISEAEDGWTEHTAEYLLARPRVTDYLTEGLVQFDYTCEE